MSVLLTLLAVVLLVPVLVFTLECLAGLLPYSEAVGHSGCRPSVAVLIPAHDEETGIAATIASIKPQLVDGDRLMVVADNCTDTTADMARKAGAEVIERFDPERRGKGYALDFGVRHLEAAPPEVVVIVDADTAVDEGAIERLAVQAHLRGRPVQVCYLLNPPPRPLPADHISSFAFLVKNLVRPLGLLRLGLPCHLAGSGMAIPFPLIRRVALASGNIVEDMQLGLDLAIAGYPAELCPEARVSGRLARGKAAITQRTRWEHGHLGTLLRQAPRLAWHAVRSGRPALMAMALDLLVPPLALLVAMLLMTSGLAVVAGMTAGMWIPVLLLSFGWTCLGTAVLLVWWHYGSRLLPLWTLALTPLYVIRKLPLYFAFALRPERVWIRTERQRS